MSCFVGFLAASPRVPRNDAEVLERVPLRSKLEGAPSSGPRFKGYQHLTLDQALEQASQWLAQHQSRPDPRWLGRIQAILGRWWNLPDPPAQVLLVRATVRQNQHDFDGALRDLEKLKTMEPVAPQVWLTLSSVHLVRGNGEQARTAALEMARRHPGLAATASAAAVAGMTGQADNAYVLLYRTLKQNAAADRSLRVWCLTLLAELSEQLGRVETAESHYHAALTLDPDLPYTLTAWSDFLLSHDRAREVVQLLQGRTLPDNLMLRWAIASKRLEPSGGDWQGMAERLQAGFDAAHRRGLAIHQREEAMFQLHLRSNPQRALELARENWAIQREPADARILLESALACGDDSSLIAMRTTLNESGLEDVRIQQLLARSGTQAKLKP